MSSKRAWWLALVWLRWCRWYSGVPRAAPRTVSPRCSGGSAGFPTQTSAPRGSKLGGGTPARFQTRVLPLLSWMCAWMERWCARRSYTGFVFSARLISCALQVALGCWASEVWQMLVWIFRMTYAHGIRTLLDVRFADDIVFFAKAFEKHFFCGRTGDVFGRSGAALERRKNKILDNSATKSERHAFEMGRRFKSYTVALHINGWDACCAQRILAITPPMWHITCRLLRKRFMHTDLFWSTGMLQRNVTTRDRFKYFDAIFAGRWVPLLGPCVTWIGRCRAMTSFIIGTKETFNFI